MQDVSQVDLRSMRVYGREQNGKRSLQERWRSNVNGMNVIGACTELSVMKYTPIRLS
jgi:hypothetical protein